MKTAGQTAGILLVDDTPDNLRLLSDLLEGEGYEVRPASSGARALAAVQAEPPDLILLDIKMPEMSGHEVCAILKSEAHTSGIPIIFISALQDTTEKVKGFALGGVDYITKPFQAEEVLARVETHLALHRLRHHLEDLVAARTAELQREISERKQAQEALQVSERQYRLLVEHVNDGIGIIQAERFVFANEALASAFGYTTAQLVGTRPADVFGPQYPPDVMPPIGASEHAAPCWQIIELAVTLHAREVWFECRQSGITWVGQPAVIVTVRDVTERKRKELELTQERTQLRRENIRLRSTLKERYRFGRLIGKSAVMQEVYELIAKASATDVNVVIYGESGTGKDLIAQTIHELSARRKYAFLPVNCGSIQETMFEREFFGHRKGSFTGALRDQPGFLEAARNGTLFLDEVGELTLGMQVKLLRAIENKTYIPVGEQTARHTDLRIVAATNRNLHDQVKSGLMRQDFFYRLNVIPITVPPLRERREDIPLLLEHFLSQNGETPSPSLLPGNIQEAFYEYDWPGNIRQLHNVLLRYLTLQRLDFGDHTSPLPHSDTGEQGLWEAVKILEKRLILDALERNQGHKTNTADMLKIPLRTLRRKMQEYDIA